jgi:hypothetical protein
MQNSFSVCHPASSCESYSRLYTCANCSASYKRWLCAVSPPTPPPSPPPLPPSPPFPLIRSDMRLRFRACSSNCCLAHVPHSLLIPCAQVAYKRCDSTVAGGCTGSNAITDLAKREAQPKCMYAALLQHTLAQIYARLLFGACVYLTLPSPNQYENMPGCLLRRRETVSCPA